MNPATSRGIETKFTFSRIDPGHIETLKYQTPSLNHYFQTKVCVTSISLANTTHQSKGSRKNISDFK